ncbi:carbohydrate ABC transporter permease [Saccharothrix violaceirubra]|uniref:Cellobiose transport system permease protein n=1 Tax=Saccharothrix violaceirubra TaxID=413306 RepID=A0A7W7T2I5_9PSEU|nr:carbohydrate ABC transporter permease [Saccharothrix violaceirubra]MBB4965368.1 cellobiose transport system permease protein [Saccharothrix violaceirubra]
MIVRRAVLAVVVVASLFPLYWAVVVASHDNAAMSARVPPLLPGGELGRNVDAVFEAVDFGAALGNSAIVASTVAVATVLLSTLAGFAFAHLRFRGRRVLFGLVLGSVLVPGQLGVVPLFELVAGLGWYGRLAAVIVPGLVSAFGVFWMRQACLEAVPCELVDAAAIDGCSLPRTWWHVVLPAVRSQALVLGAVTFLAAWNDFLWPLVALDPVESPTVQVALSHLAGGYFTDYPLVLTGAVLGTLPVVVVFALMAGKSLTGLLRGRVNP